MSKKTSTTKRKKKQSGTAVETMSDPMPAADELKHGQGERENAVEDPQPHIKRSKK